MFAFACCLSDTSRLEIFYLNFLFYFLTNFGVVLDLFFGVLLFVVVVLVCSLLSTLFVVIAECKFQCLFLLVLLLLLLFVGRHVLEIFRDFCHAHAKKQWS